MGRQVGDITDPFLVWRRCGEVLLQQIGRHRQCVTRVCGGLVLPRRFGTQALPMETGSDGFAVYRQPLITQIQGQSGST